MDRQNLHLLPAAVCRSAAFSPLNNIAEKWPQLKKMISEASPSFYEFIAKQSAPDKITDEKINHTVWKYFNRACYRPTPFGSFAAISLVPVDTFASHSHPILKGKMNISSFNDWSLKDNFNGTFKAENFRANATAYQLGNEVRFIRMAGEHFELATVPSFFELITLLYSSRQIISRQSLHEGLHLGFGLSALQVDELIRDLVDCQLLIPETYPNITGPDYFKRIGSGELSEGPHYDIAGREVLEGGLDSKKLSTIPQYINFIKGFKQQGKINDLEAFRNNFVKKFEYRAVSLATALDPEAGVGYGSTAQSHESENLTELMALLTKTTHSQPAISYSNAHKFLLNELVKGKPIRLEDYIPQQDQQIQYLPNTLSVICRFYNDHIVVENAGGCTANALIGRFTLENEEITDLGRKIAAIEQQANPGVVFFDVAYQAEKKVDNVNRREQLYAAEFPIITWSNHTAALTLDDILIQANDNEVFLWSKMYQQRLVPRIASAYNYSRSDLALYRFLCDLQHQEITTDLNFDFQAYLPGLDHYPRVTYKDIIASPAMWRIEQDKLNNIDILRKWLAENEVDFPFLYGNGDQQLLFDPAKEIDLINFMVYCRQHSNDNSYISEALQDLDSLPLDEYGQPHCAQYILNYYHQERVYSEINSPAVDGPITPNSPGGDWLYFEIYCHESRANQLLQNVIKPLVNSSLPLISQWFFIRYTDPAPHLRVRFKLTEEFHTQLVMKKMDELTHSLRASGLISDIQIKTYYPEINRYGATRMEQVEAFFGLDSSYCLKLIPKFNDAYELYPITLQLMYEWYKIAEPDAKLRLAAIKNAADNFSNEFAMTTITFKAINKSFALFKANTQEQKSSAGLKTLEKVLLKLMNTCENDETRRKLISDLVHMHVNRIFPSEQRRHEAILYQFLLKSLLMEGRRLPSRPEL